ncbi:MAG: hypothetical protein J7M38_00640 [Armatimonadetes bacterium]|nr:hypothetical protein [Armatimonadota bacterium]
MGYIKCDAFGCVRRCIKYVNGERVIVECERRSEVIAGICVCYAEPRYGEWDVVEPDDHNARVDVAKALLRMFEDVVAALAA